MTALIVTLKFIALISFILLAVKGPQKKKEAIQRERSKSFAKDNGYVDLIRRKSSGYPAH